MTDPQEFLRVDIVSDVVCPWCAIGYYQLAVAAQRSNVSLAIHWHPFELNPQMPAEGENLREHLAKKYGTSPQGSRDARAKLTALGAELGFTFNYRDDMRMWNTSRAHQLIDWAQEQGRAQECKLALLAAYFSERRDISDIEELANIATGIGLDGDAARHLLAAEERASRVRERQRHWIEQGVHGVPTMLVGERYLSTGAQGIERYQRLLENAQSELAA